MYEFISLCKTPIRFWACASGLFGIRALASCIPMEISPLKFILTLTKGTDILSDTVSEFDCSPVCMTSKSWE